MSLHVDVDVGTDDRAFVICIVCVCAWIVLIHIVCRDYACTALAGRARTRDGRRDADGRTYRSPLTSPLTARDAHTTRRVVTPGRTKSGRMQKQRPTPPRYICAMAARPTASPSTANGHTPKAKHISYMAQCVAVQYRWLMQKGHGRAVRHARVGIDRRRTRAQVVQPCNHLAPSGAVACREAQTRACRRFVPIASCCGTHANPDDSAHGGTCGACARRRT